MNPTVPAIFLSASIPDPKRDPKYHRTANVMAIRAAIAALVTVVLGRWQLVWGGHPSITPMVKIVSETNRSDYGAWVHLYQSRFFEADYPKDNRFFKNVTFTRAKDTEAESLLLMRQLMLERKYIAAFFIGGMAGVEDEFQLLRTLQPKCKVMPVASTGGAAASIFGRGDYDPRLLNDLAYVSLFRDLLGARLE